MDWFWGVSVLIVSDICKLMNNGAKEKLDDLYTAQQVLIDMYSVASVCKTRFVIFSWLVDADEEEVYVVVCVILGE